ncbi:GNAT family N-acetyltransferase [Thalassotalea hakodatensis]|uniref:GNAT family N-acetyltransferase n=1 Tax=Thalassotalea hakodatensis TaxID=3030492 RepID=UPI002573B067|nr:GNAT family N-acetyltransferase [Thalassotalea hakodatensis]
MMIREIQEKDLTAVLSLIQAKAEFDGCIDSLILDEEILATMFFSQQPKVKAIVAEINSQLVGIATYYEIYSTFLAKPGLWLDDLYIYEEYRGYGFGKELIKRLCQISKDNDMARIDWIVASDNDSGRQFYQAIGATIAEDIRHTRLDKNAIEQIIL